MDQYIITEEELRQIEGIEYPMTSEERYRLSDAIRSRPYQNQREPVGIDGLTNDEYEHQKLVEEIEILHDKLKNQREKWDEFERWLDSMGEISDADAKHSENYVESSGNYGKGIAYRVALQKFQKLRGEQE